MHSFDMFSWRQNIQLFIVIADHRQKRSADWNILLLRWYILTCFEYKVAELDGVNAIDSRECYYELA
jgi:hypothetical protein